MKTHKEIYLLHYIQKQVSHESKVGQVTQFSINSEHL